MKDIEISVIIPCFNHGIYIQEALDSVLITKYPFEYEIIIINDGSTDPITIKILEGLNDSRIQVIHQKNAGPSVARNNAISHSRGKYILPLDADNKISPKFLCKGFEILTSNEGISIVHSKGIKFGLNNKSEFGGIVDFQQLVLYNTVDTCALFRKTVWEKVGGYDEFLSKRGLEDWDFWLCCAENGFKFHFIDEVLFYYRENENSRTMKVANNNLEIVVNYIQKKHANFIVETYKALRFDFNNLLKSREYSLGIMLLSPLRKLSHYFKQQAIDKND